MSKEFSPRGITVNAISPGATEAETYRTAKGEQVPASLEAMSAFGRLGQPDEIAAAVAFLASDAGRLGDRPDHPRQRRHGMTPQ